MRALTIREAKAKLNELVDAATRGEQVVLLRRSKHVAAIVPITADDLELAPRLGDPQAERLWRALAEERSRGGSLEFRTAELAVRHLAGRPVRRRARAAARTRRR